VDVVDVGHRPVPANTIRKNVLRKKEAHFKSLRETLPVFQDMVLVGKPEGKRPLGRPRRRWEDGIKMDLRETGWGCVEWIHLVQDRDRWRGLL
jgi:hypothetical protein